MQLEHVSGAENGAERAENRVERSGAERSAGVAEKRWSGAERGAGGRGAGIILHVRLTLCSC